MELAEEVAALRDAHRDKDAAVRLMHDIEAAIHIRRAEWMDDWEALNREWLTAVQEYTDADARFKRISAGIDKVMGLTL